MGTTTIGSYLAGQFGKELPNIPQRPPLPYTNADGTIDDSPLPQVLADREAAASAPPVSSFLESAGQMMSQAAEAEQQARLARSQILTGAGETALTAATGTIGFGAGIGQFVGRMYADANKMAEPDYWKRLYNMAHEVAADMTYSPRTELGQLGAQGLSLAMTPLEEFSRMASDAPLARMVLTEDQRYALRFAHGLLTLAAIDPILSAATGSIRSRIANFRSEFSKAVDTTPTSSPKLIQAAQSVTDAVKTSPEISSELQAAQQRLVSTLQQRGQSLASDAGLRQHRQLVTDLTDALDNLPEGTPQRIRETMQSDLAKAREQLRVTETQQVVAPMATPEETGQIPPPAPGMARLYRADLPVGERQNIPGNVTHFADTSLEYIKGWRDVNAPGSGIYYVDVPWDPNNPLEPMPPVSITPQQRAQLQLLPEGTPGEIAQTPSPSSVAPVETVRPPDLQSRVFDEVMKNPKTSTGDIAKTLGVSTQTAGRALRTLESAGKITSNVVRGRKQYNVTEAPAELSVDIPPTEPNKLLTTPGEINNKIWYHGTGEKGLTAESLDATVTRIENLFGQGVYLTDNPDIAQGYAKTRGRRTGGGQVYQARLNLQGKILNLEEPATPEFIRTIRDTLDAFDPDIADNLNDVAKRPGVTGDQVWGAMAEDIAQQSHGEGVPISEYYDLFGQITQKLREQGYDALTHVGGKRTGNAPHQVLVLLDPRDVSQVGRGGQVAELRPVGEAPAPATTDATPAIAKPMRVRKTITAPEVVLAQPEAITTPPQAEPVAAPEGPTRYLNATTLENLRSNIQAPPGGGTETTNIVPMQVKTIDGKPNAVLFDDRNMNVVTSINEIRAQEAQGKLSPEIARIMELNLQRQADIADVPIEQAHNFTGEWLRREIMQLADEHNLEVYKARRVKGGLEYDQVPREAISGEAKLANSSLIEPTKLTKDEAGAVVENRTTDLGPVTLEEVQKSLETGDDISARLPLDAQKYYEQLRSIIRQGIDQSNERNYIDIFNDLLDVVAPPDVPPTEVGMLNVFGMTPARKAAMYRLYADAMKKGLKFADVLRRSGLPETEQIIAQRHMDSLAKPPIPPGPVDPQYVALDPRAAAAGDPIIAPVRKYRDGRQFPPKYLSEAQAFQNAPRIEKTALARAYDATFSNAYYVLRKAGLDNPVMTAYRAAQTSADLWKHELAMDLKKLSRPLNREARRRIGEYAIAQQEKGRELLAQAGKEAPKELTPNELNFYQTSQELLKYTHQTINDIRKATGQKPIPELPDYWPFVRTFNIAQRLGLSPNLVLDSPEKLASHAENFSNTPFVHAKARTKALYVPETDAFVLLQNYMHSAIDQITLGPFIAKLDELINHPMPRLPTTPGKGKTWSLEGSNPQLYNYLNNWKNYLATGSNLTLLSDPAANRLVNRVFNFAGRNIGLSTLTGKLRTAGVQLAPVATTVHQIGAYNTLQGIGDLLVDGIYRGFKNHNEHLQYSNVLRTRDLDTALNITSASLVDGNPANAARVIGRGIVNIGRKGLMPMRFFDSLSAHIAYEGAFKLAKEKLGVDNVKAGEIADNVVVMTQGGTMPGDLVGIQRNSLGRLLTEFQRFLIGDFNYILNEVFGGETYMKRMLREAKGKPEPNFYWGMTKNIVTFVGLWEAANAAYEAAGMHAPYPSPVVATAKRAFSPQDEPAYQRTLGTLGTLASELSEYSPVLGPTRYGRGLAGPFVDTAREAYSSIKSEPLSYPLSKPDDTVVDTFVRFAGSPIARLLGLPFAGAIGTAIRGADKDAGVWGSLVGTNSGPTQRGITQSIRQQGGQGIRRAIR